MSGIPLIRMMVLLPKGGSRYVPPPTPPPGTSEGVTNESGQVVVNEDGDAPIGSDE